MRQSDWVEQALTEIERLRAQQDAELQAAYTALADLGPMMLEVTGDHLVQLSECTECDSRVPSSAPRGVSVVLARC